MAPMKKSVIISGVVIVAALLAFVKFFHPAKAPETSNTPSSGDRPLVSPEEASERKLSVKTHYNNPGGGDDVAFAVLVNGNGVITAAETEVLAQNGISITRQKSFAEAFPATVIGKKLADLAPLDRVGGSSLTTNAFNASLPELKSKL